MSSSSGSSRSQVSEHYWRRNADSSSPIPYRQAPLEYTPAVPCKCGAKAAQYISWSDDNPAVRYLKCARAREGGCDFYRFVDPPVTGFLKEVVLDLRDAVKYWKGQTGLAERRLEEQRTETARVFDVAGREKQRLQADLEAAVKFNEDRCAMFVEARTQAANLQAALQNGDLFRDQLQLRIRSLEKERKLLFGALFVCIIVVAASWMPWRV